MTVHLLGGRRRWSPRAGRLALLIPLGAFLAIFFAWPLLSILLRSLDPAGVAHWGGPSIEFHNYTQLFRDSVLRQVLKNTVVLAVWSTVITALLAFPVAYLISRLPRRTGLALLTLIMVPFWVSILVRLFAFTQLLGREGVINNLAHQVGLGPYDLLFNRTATIVGMVAYLLPYMILILYSGMSGIDTNLITAAKTLGASSGQAFRRIYFPLVRPSLMAGVLLIFVLSLGFFLTPAVLGGPGDTTVAVYIQQQLETFQWGFASATGMLLLVVTLIGYAGAVRWGGMGMLAGGVSGGGKGVAAREPLRMSATTVLLWVAAVVVLVVLISPLVIIVPESFNQTRTIIWPPRGFTTDWYTVALSDPVWTTAIKKSAVVGAGTAILSTLIGLLLARVALQIRSAARRSLLQTLVYAPLVVPVILLAIGIYDVEARLHLLGTSIGLIFAHAVIAFPLAFAVLSTALANVDPALEQAAWTLGASRRRTFWTVVLPNVLPSLVGALLITFVTSWDEAVIALFQTGLSKTLPVTIFSFLKSGVEPSVAAIATMLVGVVVVAVVASVLLAARRGRRSRNAPIPIAAAEPDPVGSEITPVA